MCRSEGGAAPLWPPSGASPVHGTVSYARLQHCQVHGRHEQQLVYLFTILYPICILVYGHLTK